ncbi:hypothetical protein QBC47DRAFT_70572 [Echria macrotheca]|uniref:Uncharacterized protein n=1 Tax=Echria macrotheca TaxID=438768 RepID=A0AAJ0F5P2_9PEZI|nr:hypothetical protein QBC47DRAFT_70572 [Echria macrotheca]
MKPIRAPAPPSHDSPAFANPDIHPPLGPFATLAAESGPGTRRRGPTRRRGVLIWVVVARNRPQYHASDGSCQHAKSPVYAAAAAARGWKDVHVWRVPCVRSEAEEVFACYPAVVPVRLLCVTAKIARRCGGRWSPRRPDQPGGKTMPELIAHLSSKLSLLDGALFRKRSGSYNATGRIASRRAPARSIIAGFCTREMKPSLSQFPLKSPMAAAQLADAPGV